MLCNSHAGFVRNLVSSYAWILIIWRYLLTFLDEDRRHTGGQCACVCVCQQARPEDEKILGVSIEEWASQAELQHNCLAVSLHHQRRENQEVKIEVRIAILCTCHSIASMTGDEGLLVLSRHVHVVLLMLMSAAV